MTKRAFHVTLFLLILGISAFLVYLPGCSNSGGGGDGKAGDFVSININLGSNSQDIRMFGDVLWSSGPFPVVYDIKKKHGGPFDSVTLDIADHLSAIQITPPGVVFLPRWLMRTAVAATDSTADMYIMVDRVEALETVCTTGKVYGPFRITLDAVTSQPSSADPPSVEADQSTLDIINTGGYAVCIQVLPPFDAVVDLNRLGFEAGKCSEPPAQIAGNWGGTYHCDSDFGSEDGEVLMTIVQDQADLSIASYSDGYANYQGSVCGKRFSFTGGTPEYNESGTFVLNPDGSASKTSTYRSVPPGTSRGTCSDVLARAP